MVSVCLLSYYVKLTTHLCLRMVAVYVILYAFTVYTQTTLPYKLMYIT